MKVLAGRVGALVVVVVLSVGSVGAVASSAGAVSLTRDQAFVTSAYEDFLGRAPTAGELSLATSGSLVSAGARALVVSGLANSSEWIRVTVDKLYVDTLGRVGDPGGVNYWVGVLQSRRLSVASVAASFYSSPEYFAGFGQSSVSVWIGDLYRKILLRDGASDPSGVGVLGGSDCPGGSSAGRVRRSTSRRNRLIPGSRRSMRSCWVVIRMWRAGTSGRFGWCPVGIWRWRRTWRSPRSTTGMRGPVTG